MHREESKINTNKESSEMYFSLIIHYINTTSNILGRSIIIRGERIKRKTAPILVKHNENEQQHNKYHVREISKEALAKITPVSPPIVNKKIKPIAKSKGVLSIIFLFYIVVIN